MHYCFVTTMRVCFVCLCVCVCDNVVHTICVTNYQAVPGHHVDHGEEEDTVFFSHYVDMLDISWQAKPKLGEVFFAAVDPTTTTTTTNLYQN